MFNHLLRIYSILYTLLMVLYLPVFAYRVLLQNKRFGTLIKRLSAPENPSSKYTTAPWIHAVSVGEIKAVQPLVEALLEDHEVVLVSTVTETGHSLACSLFPDRVQIFYFPIDWKWLCYKYLRILNPAFVLLAETEIWPGFINAAHSLKIPVLLINGRISGRSFPRYYKIRLFLQPLLQQVELFCMQSRQDRERIIKLGALPDRVYEIGNLKYDYQLPENSARERVRDMIGDLMVTQPQDLLWICGSTREGEEELLLTIYEQLLGEFPSLRLLLAPRHPHRVEVISRLVGNLGFSFCRRSQLNTKHYHSPQILLLDSIGDLSYLYKLADVVFMGGSLVEKGGHNVIEAAYFAKPILFGPHMENFHEISQTFLNAYAAVQVESVAELTLKLRELLKDPKARKWLGRNARKVIRKNQGAIQRTLEILQNYKGPIQRKGNLDWHQ